MNTEALINATLILITTASLGLQILTERGIFWIFAIGLLAIIGFRQAGIGGMKNRLIRREG